jgi:hypothetical protein
LRHEEQYATVAASTIRAPHLTPGKDPIVTHPALPVTLLLTAWDDLDRANADVSDTDMLRRIDGASCFAWTLAHVTYGIDSWINKRFQEMPLDPLLSDPRFGYGGDGGADDWPAIRDAITKSRDRLRPYLLTLSDADLNLTLPYDGSYAPFRERGINLRVAIVQNAIHHIFHLGEIVAKRELMGYDTGSFPGAFGAALMGTEYDDWSKRQSAHDNARSR